MQEPTVSCGCGRTMGLDGRRGRGAYRCGCGAWIRLTEASRESRQCWYAGCHELATTSKPLELCPEHERETVNRLAHLVVRFDWGAVLDASDAIEETHLRPLDGYKQPKPRSFEGWVYFMRRERYIKIGTTTDLQRRAQQLNAYILARRPGSYSEEAQLHARFDHLRQHGEWFEPGPDLVALINQIRAADGEPPIAA